MDTWVILVVFLALGFEYVNGFHDAANAIATSVLTRALSIRAAVVMCACLNFIGAISSTAVAKTMGQGLVDPTNITASVVVAALIGAILWDLITWHYGLPTSSTHALVGGIVGAVAGHKGLAVLKYEGIHKVLVGLVLSPVVGILAACTVMILFLWIFGKKAPRKLNRDFRHWQILSAGLMAFSHGSNDGQKTMGIIAMALASGAALAHGGGAAAHFVIPTWVKLSCACAMGLGSGAGGWRIIKTIGRNMIELQPIQGCVAESSAAVVILAASHLGAPISTTHTISSTIMGVGMTKRFSAVKWKTVGNVVMAWILTLPLSALLGFCAVEVVQLIVR
ncbi:MAG: inorganic phosphate transporter [Armatimonadetes bacterium]|nr:inorganic phosphate transporter [Armatimonadota bacterium]